MTMPNRELKNRILDKLLDDERTNDSPIEIVDNNGVVTLSGAVPSVKVWQAAEEITEQVEGVKSVINDLKIEEHERDFLKYILAAGLGDLYKQN